MIFFNIFYVRAVRVYNTITCDIRQTSGDGGPGSGGGGRRLLYCRYSTNRRGDVYVGIFRSLFFFSSRKNGVMIHKEPRRNVRFIWIFTFSTSESLLFVHYYYYYYYAVYRFCIMYFVFEYRISIFGPYAFIIIFKNSFIFITAHRKIT